MLFSVFTPKVASKLRERGFSIVNIEPSRNNPRYYVYQFENTVDFQDALREVVAEEKMIKKQREERKHKQ